MHYGKKLIDDEETLVVVRPVNAFVYLVDAVIRIVETVSVPTEILVPSVEVAAAPAESVSVPTEVFAPPAAVAVVSAESVFVPIEVFVPAAGGFVAFVDLTAISTHNMNRDEKCYDSAAIFHDIG